MNTVVNCGTDAINQIMRIIDRILVVIYIAVPVILIIMGSIDLIKAILQSDEKEMKKAQQLLWYRLAYGALVFLLGIFISFVLRTIAGADFQNCLNEGKGLSYQIVEKYELT